MWLFENPDFQAWLARREERQPGEDLQGALAQRCVSCGVGLSQVPFVKGRTCGFCLAFEFGYDCHLDRLAEAIAAVTRLACDDDPQALKALCRQLLEDTHDALRLGGA